MADARFCFAIPDAYGDAEAAPLLCAGLIGHRALRMAGDPRRLGLYGFGAAAHIVAQVARHEGREVYAFTRDGDRRRRISRAALGAVWAGGSDEAPPEPLDAAIIFAPVGALVPAALRAVDRGGAVVCAGIHMSDIPSFPYSILWEERSIRSVANLTRADGEAFMALAPKVPVRTEVEVLPLSSAVAALDRLRAGEVTGALVLAPEPTKNRRGYGGIPPPALAAFHTTRMLLELPGIALVERPPGTAPRGPAAASSRNRRRPLRPDTGAQISRMRAWSSSSDSTRPRRGFSIAQITPASTAAVTCSEVALLCGARRRASSIVRREPYQ